MSTKEIKKIEGIRLTSHFGETYIYNNSKILRAIKPEYEEWARELLKSGLIDELVDLKLFPKTKISKINIDASNLIIEQEKIPIRTSFPTWSFEMIKQSANTVLKVNEIANKYGYELRDGHLTNTMFHFGQCKFIDFDSFIKKDNDKWIAFREFVESSMKLLQLLSLQTNYEYQNSIKGMEYYIPDKLYEAIIPKENRIDRHTQINLSKLSTILSQLELPNEPSLWSNYHDDEDEFNSTRVDYIINLIHKYHPKTIVDLASNAGLISKKILKDVPSTEFIVCIDRDHIAINKLFRNLTNERIFPMHCDITFEFSSLYIDKPKCDMAMCLALTHHLILSAKYDIDYIFKLIKSYTHKYVAIEFMPLGLYNGNINSTPPIPEWYNEVWFEKHFKRHFNLIKKKQTELNRILFFGDISNHI